MKQFLGYKIVYLERDKNFRNTKQSAILKQIAEFSSSYFVLDLSMRDAMYNTMYVNARIDRERELIENYRFQYDPFFNLMYTYLTLVPYNVDEFTDIFLKLTDDYPEELYKINADICKASLQLIALK